MPQSMWAIFQLTMYQMATSSLSLALSQVFVEIYAGMDI